MIISNIVERKPNTLQLKFEGRERCFRVILMTWVLNELPHKVSIASKHALFDHKGL